MPSEPLPYPLRSVGGSSPVCSAGYLLVAVESGSTQGGFRSGDYVEVVAFDLGGSGRFQECFRLSAVMPVIVVEVRVAVVVATS